VFPEMAEAGREPDAQLFPSITAFDFVFGGKRVDKPVEKAVALGVARVLQLSSQRSSAESAVVVLLSENATNVAVRFAGMAMLHFGEVGAQLYVSLVRPLPLAPRPGAPVHNFDIALEQERPVLGVVGIEIASPECVAHDFPFGTVGDLRRAHDACRRSNGVTLAGGGLMIERRRADHFSSAWRISSSYRCWS